MGFALEIKGSSKSQHLDISSGGSSGVAAGGGCTSGSLPLSPPSLGFLLWSSTPWRPPQCSEGPDFSFSTLVCHLVPSSPKDLGLQVQGFWPVGLWGPLQVGLPAGWGYPEAASTSPSSSPIPAALHQACRKPGLLQESSASWAWASQGRRCYLVSHITVHTKGYCPSSEGCAWSTQVLTKGS